MTEWVGPWPGTLAKVDGDVDAELEARLADGSALAFHIAYGVLRNRADAEEIAQEACARAFRRFHQLRERDRFRSWLTRMAWRLAIDRWRADRRRAVREDATSRRAESSNSEDVVIARERSALVWRAIDSLPEKQRLVIVLSAIEGHDTRDVARLLGIPEGTVKSRLFAARKTLAGQLRCLVTDS